VGSSDAVQFSLKEVLEWLVARFSQLVFDWLGDAIAHDGLVGGSGDGVVVLDATVASA
jgi:hypothetical protein